MNRKAISNVIEEMNHEARAKALGELLRIIDHGNPAKGDVAKLDAAMRALDLTPTEVEQIAEARADYSRESGIIADAEKSLADRADEFNRLGQLDQQIEQAEAHLKALKQNRDSLRGARWHLEQTVARTRDRLANIAAACPLAVGRLPGDPIEAKPTGPSVSGAIPATPTPATPPPLRRTLAGAGFTPEKVREFIGNGQVLIEGRLQPDGLIAGPVVVEDPAAVPA